MEYKTIDDVYTANLAIREKFKAAVAGLTDDRLNARPDEQTWSIAQIVEHVTIVNEGMSRICAKLLSKAEAAGMTGDGSLNIANEFVETAASVAHQKLKAPEMVEPVGGVPVADSIAKLDELQSRFAELRSQFEAVDGTGPKFPHPYFGDLSAQEWLVLSGAHEARHLRQIRRIAADVW
jgi:hypothetical protein